MQLYTTSYRITQFTHNGLLVEIVVDIVYWESQYVDNICLHMPVAVLFNIDWILVRNI